MARPGTVGAAGASLLLIVLLAGCSGSDTTTPTGSDPPVPSSGASGSSGVSGASGSSGSVQASPGSAAEPAAVDLSRAESEPRQDPVYPTVGNPVVDALHYDLDLTWDGDRHRLSGTETLTFRAAQDSGNIPLDFSGALTVRSIALDDQPDVGFVQRGDDLFVKRSVAKDQRHQLTIRYAGTPLATAAPTTRSDFATMGWQYSDDSGESFTMQEPYGAFTWYAVNDQPADKAFYDFTLHTSELMTGVANGVLLSDRAADGRRTTRWHLDSPASSYLVTVDFGHFDSLEATGRSGVPLQVWSQKNTRYTRDLTMKAFKQAFDWAESRLGPYPFSSLGLVLVDSMSGMETQTMLTLGDNQYTTSADVIAHETVHQWYGDTVSPTDWRGVWMNEGMTMYLQWVFHADHHKVQPLAGQIEEARRYLPTLLEQAGPPADYDPTTFGNSNVYYVPAVMWHQLRQAIGDEEFWRLVKEWPAEHRWSNADYDDITAWWSQKTGRDLQPYFDSWLLDGRQVRVP